MAGESPATLPLVLNLRAIATHYTIYSNSNCAGFQGSIEELAGIMSTLVSN